MKNPQTSYERRATVVTFFQQNPDLLFQASKFVTINFPEETNGQFEQFKHQGRSLRSKKQSSLNTSFQNLDFKNTQDLNVYQYDQHKQVKQTMGQQNMAKLNRIQSAYKTTYGDMLYVNKLKAQRQARNVLKSKMQKQSLLQSQLGSSSSQVLTRIFKTQDQGILAAGSIQKSSSKGSLNYSFASSQFKTNQPVKPNQAFKYDPYKPEKDMVKNSVGAVSTNLIEIPEEQRSPCQKKDMNILDIIEISEG